MKNAPCAKLTMRMMPKIKRQADTQQEQQRGLRQRVQTLGDKEAEEVHQQAADAATAPPRPLREGVRGRGRAHGFPRPPPPNPLPQGAGGFFCAVAAGMSVQLSKVIWRQAGVTSSPG